MPILLIHFSQKTHIERCIILIISKEFKRSQTENFFPFHEIFCLKNNMKRTNPCIELRCHSYGSMVFWQEGVSCSAE